MHTSYTLFMKKLLFFTAFLIIGIINVFTQEKENPCKIMHSGTFVYGKKLDHVVVIDKNIKTEDWGYGKFKMTSNIVWENDCEYYATTLKVSKVNFKYNVGDRLHVKITRVIGNKIYYRASRTSYSWNGFFIKKKDK